MAQIAIEAGPENIWVQEYAQSGQIIHRQQQAGLQRDRDNFLRRVQCCLKPLVEALSRRFDGYLSRQSYITRGGQIMDASIVSVPKNHNTRDENKTIKNGEKIQVPDRMRRPLPTYGTT